LLTPQSLYPSIPVSPIWYLLLQKYDNLIIFFPWTAYFGTAWADLENQSSYI
jgi:hypothetical protein